ncbi:MAG TPA: hypothetical protein DDY17_11080 [Syntrophaceae bacterium]|jgi:hypothetical protein|nr:hypothetical protein [Syntrophaceae bacterium]
MNVNKRQKKFTVIIIQDERLLCSFKLPVNFFKICLVAVIGVIILFSATVLLHNKTNNSNKEELITRPETQHKPPETKNHENEISIAAVNSYNLSIEDFRSRFDLRRKLFHYSFLIRNKDAKNATASGYIFVILKSEGLGPDQWLPYPQTILTNGVPQNFKDGDPFSITKHKVITKDISTQHIYDSTLIFVFSNDGKRILEKNFSLKN